MRNYNTRSNKKLCNFLLDHFNSFKTVKGEGERSCAPDPL